MDCGVEHDGYVKHEILHRRELGVFKDIPWG